MKGLYRDFHCRGTLVGVPYQHHPTIPWVVGVFGISEPFFQYLPHGVFHTFPLGVRGVHLRSHPSPLQNSLGAAPEAKTPWGSHHHPRLVIHVKLMDENGKPRPIRGSPFRPTLTKCLGPLKGWLPIHREKLGGETKHKGGFFLGVGFFERMIWTCKKMNSIYFERFFQKKNIWVFLLQFFEKWLFELKKYTLTEFSIQLVSILEERRPSLTSCTLQLQKLFHHGNINRRLSSCLISTLVLYRRVNPDIVYI